MQVVTKTGSLHETDLNLWLEETVSLLRKGELVALDIDILAEEIEDMGRSDKRALEQNLIRVLQHLLKWQYQPQKNEQTVGKLLLPNTRYA